MGVPITHLEGSAVVAIMYVLLASSFCFVLMRAYARYFVQNLFTLSDVFTTISFFFLLICVVMHTLMWKWGFWKYDVNFSPQSVIMDYRDNPHLEILLKMSYMGLPFAFTGVWFNKASLCLLYYQLIPAQEKKLMWALHATSVFCAISYLYIIPMNLLWCQPVSSNWTTNNTCFNIFHPVPMYSTFILNITTQLCLMFLPLFLLRILYKSNTSPVSRRKVITMGITFGLIGLSIVAMIANFALLIGVATDSVVALCSDVEQSLTIILVCVPSFRFLFMKKFTQYREVYREHVHHKKEEEEKLDELTSLNPDDLMLMAIPPNAPPVPGTKRSAPFFAIHDDGSNFANYHQRRMSHVAGLEQRRRSTVDARGIAMKNMGDKAAGTKFRPLDVETGEGGLFQVGSGNSTPDSRRSREEERDERKGEAPAVSSSSGKQNSPPKPAELLRRVTTTSTEAKEATFASALQGQRDDDVD